MVVKINLLNLAPGSYIFIEKNVMLDASSLKLQASKERLTSHLDFRFISETTTIGIDSIREGTGFLRTKPAIGQYKVLVIDNFHLATNEAQNAFLKILEEPPPYAYIFLVTPYIDRLLKTIVSRVQIIRSSKFKVKSAKLQFKVQNLLTMNIGERFLWLENELKGLDDKKAVKVKLLEIIDEFLREGVELVKQNAISFEALDYLKEACWKIEQGFPSPKLLIEGFFTLL